MRTYTYVVEQRVVEELVEWDENDLHAATRAFGHLVVSYWEDSPVHEMRIVAIAVR